MSDKNLDKLIAQLKSEAIDKAEKESQSIIEAANKKAESIVKKAKEARQLTLSEAEKEAQDIVSKGESALKQAARDLNVTVKHDLLKLFEIVLKKEVEKSFTPDLIKTIVVNVVGTLGKNIELKLPKDTEQQLVDTIHKQLQQSGNSVSIIKDENLLKGLSITKTDEGWSYQITPEEVAAVLNGYLSKKWIHILES